MPPVQGTPACTTWGLRSFIEAVVLPLAASSILAPAFARDGYVYVVEAETKDDEKFVINGPSGRLLCSAMTYCFGLDPGDAMVWTRDPYAAEGETVFYDDFARKCEVYSCDSLPSRPALTPTPTPTSAGTSAGAPVPAPSGGCKAARISDPNPFMGQSGEVIVLSDGTVWQVGIGEYNYLYAYYASVTLCDGRLIFKDKTIKVAQLK